MDPRGRIRAGGDEAKRTASGLLPLGPAFPLRGAAGLGAIASVARAAKAKGAMRYRLCFGPLRNLWYAQAALSPVRRSYAPTLARNTVGHESYRRPAAATRKTGDALRARAPWIYSARRAAVRGRPSTAPRTFPTHPYRSTMHHRSFGTRAPAHGRRRGTVAIIRITRSAMRRGRMLPSTRACRVAASWNVWRDAAFISWAIRSCGNSRRPRCAGCAARALSATIQSLGRRYCRRQSGAIASI